MSKWKKRILFTIGVVLIFAAITIPTIILLNHLSSDEEQKRKTKIRDLEYTFVQRYGSEAKLVEIIEPEKMYIFIWDEVGNSNIIRHYSLSINGLFVELGETTIKNE